MEVNLYIFNFESIMYQNISRLTKVVVFIFIVVITDKGLGLILRKLYFNQSLGQNSTLNHVFSNCNADVLIFGNSRAQHHYDTRIISNALKMSCYNAGQDGGHSIILPYAQIKVLTERYSPKIIILEFSPENVVHFTGIYDGLYILLPYYKEYPEISSLILLRGSYESIKLLSSIYPFNSNIINIIRFNTNYHAERKKDYDGYVPLKRVMSNDMVKPIIETETEKENRTQSFVEANLVKALENIIYLCKMKDISLFIITSPIFHTHYDKRNPQSAASKLSLEIISRNQVKYLDFSFDTAFCGHFEWFSDRGHLNEVGSKVFSNMLIDSISKIIGTNTEMESNLDGN